MAIKESDLSPEDLWRELKARGGHGQSHIRIYGKARRDLDHLQDQILHKELIKRQRAAYAPNREDARWDFWQVKAEGLKDDARCAVALVHGVYLKASGARWLLETQEYGRFFKLCSEEPHWTQPIRPFGSGVLVAPDLVATAAHCAHLFPLDRVRVVLGFRIDDENTRARTELEGNQVYSISGIVAEDRDADWALLRLSEGVPQEVGKVARVRSAGAIEEGKPVHMAGHPCGLPLKIATAAHVTSSDPKEPFFHANLDAFGGNSGSPVFHGETHELEGILSRGAPDFVAVGRCMRSCVTPLVGGRPQERGEQCVRASLFRKHLQG